MPHPVSQSMGVNPPRKDGILRSLDCINLNGKFYCTERNGLNVLKLIPDGSIDFLYLNPKEKIKSALGVVSADVPLFNGRKQIIVSDYRSHSLIVINEDDQTYYLVNIILQGSMMFKCYLLI